MVLPCFRCGRQLESAMPDAENHPYAGTVFTSRGHYGSTVFDPMDGISFLEITICDECLKAQAAYVLEGTAVRQPPQTQYRKWQP